MRGCAMVIRRARRRVSGSAGVMRRRSFVRRTADARRRSAAVAARRRSARVSRWSGHHDRRTLQSFRRVPRTYCRSAPHRRRYRGVVAESSPRSGPQRLPAIVQAWFRPTRHPVQTPARRCHGGVTSRRVDVVVSQPRSTPPSPQLDVAGTPGEGLPRRLRDTRAEPACSDKVCGAPSGALHRPLIVVSGW